MKTFFVLATIVISSLIPASVSAQKNGGVGHGGGDITACTEALALVNATRVINLMGEINNDPGPASIQTTNEMSAENFKFNGWFDAGLTAPSYDILVGKKDCRVLSVQAGNNEG